MKTATSSFPRDARLRMTINGKPVCEIDVRASYLTILHARHNVPFEVSEEHDPYDIPGLSRFAVKSWVAILLRRQETAAALAS